MRRSFTLTGVCLALSLAIGIGSASAKTVYDYTYSGTFIDGSTIGKPFNSGLGGLAFDRHTQRLMIANGGTPGTISRFTTSGTPVAFAALGTPWFQIEPSIDPNADIAIDQSGGPTDGNFYVRGGGFSGKEVTGYKPDGSPLAASPKGAGAEFSCGAAVSPDGKEVLPHPTRRNLPLRRGHRRAHRGRLRRP